YRPLPREAARGARRARARAHHRPAVEAACARQDRHSPSPPQGPGHLMSHEQHAAAGQASTAAATDSLTPADAGCVLHGMPIELRWRDLDAFNHVNNSTFMTYLEEARIRWFESLDEDWVTEDTAPLLAAVQMNYRQPIPYPGSIVVELTADRFGTSSVT